MGISRNLVTDRVKQNEKVDKFKYLRSLIKESVRIDRDNVNRVCRQ